MIETSAIPQVEFTDPATVRLISTAYIAEPALQPLADSSDDLKVLEELEALTSRRLDLAMPLPAGMLREELLTEAHGYGWTYINAAFCYTRTTGNRFNGPERGAWYATWGEGAAAAAQREVAWHLTRELANTGVFENVTDYRELVAGFTCRLHDLTDLNHCEFLMSDVDIAYPAGQVLAKNLRAIGSGGVIYKSTRYDGGNCLAAFRPNLVQNIRQGATWRFTWAGAQEPKIAKL